MTITAEQVNKLRKATGAGMMNCKKALVEADGNFEHAIDILRKQGQKIAAKRSNKEAKEGKVWVTVNQDTNKGYGFSLNCETESVAKTADFLALGDNILRLAQRHTPTNRAELLDLTSAGQSIQAHITDLVGKIGEKIDLSEYVYHTSDRVVSYLHGNKIGVLVDLSGNVEHAQTVGQNLAMQIAAMNPIALSGADIPTDTLEKEREIAIEKARNEGKPEQILTRIGEGATRKFIKNHSLLEQIFIKNSKLTVSKYLKNARGMIIKRFSRLSIS